MFKRKFFKKQKNKNQVSSLIDAAVTGNSKPKNKPDKNIRYLSGLFSWLTLFTKRGTSSRHPELDSGSREPRFGFPPFFTKDSKNKAKSQNTTSSKKSSVILNLIQDLFSKKTLKVFMFTILVIFIVSTAFFFLTKSSGNKAEAGWFNDNWTYRQKIVVTNNTTAETDVYISFDAADVLDTSDTSKFQADCDDIRFTTQTGELLEYYIVSGCSSASTDIDVLIPTFSAGTQSIYMYYGNSTVAGVVSVTTFSTEASNYTIGTPASEEVGPGPVAYWKFDENAGTTAYDYTNNSNDLTFNNSPTWDNISNTGSSLRFERSNSQYLSGSDSVSLSLTSDFTIGAWVHPTQNTASTNYPIAGKWDEGTGKYSYLLEQYGDEIRLYVESSSNYESTDNANLQPNKWYYIVATYDSSGQTVDIYINGVLQASSTTGTIPASIGDDTENFYIGHNGGSAIPTNVNYQTTSSASDAHEYNNNSGYDDSGSSLYCGGLSSAGAYVCGAYFSNVTVPQGATVTSATFDFQNNWNGTYDTEKAVVYMEDVDDSTTFSSGSSPYDRSTRTTASADWVCSSSEYISPGVWFSATSNCQPPSITSVVQEIIDRGGWSSGNSMALILDGHPSGTNDYYFDTRSYDYGTTDGPKLSITYTTPSGGFYDGFIDEVKIYPYARSANEIKEDFNKGGVVLAADTSYLSNGLVGYWKMDDAGIDAEGETITDASGNGNDGTLYGDDSTGDNGTGMDCTAGGKFGTGCEFDGVDDYAETGGSVDIAENGARSYALWAKLDTIIDWGVLFTPQTGNLGYLGIWGTTERLDTRICTDTDSTKFASVQLGSSYLDQWHYYVASYDPKTDTVYLYMDGELVDETFLAGSGCDAYSATNKVVFGAKTGAANPADVTLDEVRIYNRALSPAEVRDLYNWAPGPVLHLPMDDNVIGDAQTIVDNSGNGNNGTTEYGADTSGMNCTVQGQYGGGCDFDGVDDYIGIANNTDLDFPNAVYSISVWVKTTDGDGAIINKGDEPALEDGWNLGLGTGPSIGSISGEVYFQHREYASGQDDKAYVDGVSLNDGQWHHITAVSNGGYPDFNIYIDGVKQTLNYFRSDGNTDASSTYDISIGGNSTSSSNYLNGALDDVRIYNYALSEKQIRNIMNARPVTASAVGSPVGSPVHHYKLDETDNDGSATVSDSGSNPINLNSSSSDYSFIKNGKIGGALESNGTTTNFGTSSTVNYSDEISFTAWITTDGYDSGSTKMNLVGLPGYNPTWGYVFGQEGQALYLRFQDSNPTWRTSYSDDVFTASNESQWHHVAVTHDTTQVKFYFNGKHVGGDSDFPYTAGSADNTVSLSYSGVESWYGLIDEVKIYNYALTAQEVALDYNSGAIQFGSLSTESDGTTPSNSADRSYCVPGDTSTCSAPVFEMLFDEQVSGDSQTYYDTSGNGNNGTSSDSNGSGFDCTPNGVQGTACNFDGVDDSISISNPTEDDFGTGAMTVSTWFKSSTTDVQQTIIDNKTAGTNNAGFNLQFLSSNDLYFRVANGSTQGGASVAGSSWLDGNWHYIVGVLDRSGGDDYAYLYVDGSLVKATNLSDGWDITSSQTIYISTYNGSAAPVDGAIDQVRLYDYARTPAQVAWDYNRGEPVAWYKFDECQGTTINDWASNGLGDFNGSTGTLTVGATGDNASVGTCNSGAGDEAWDTGTNGKFGAALSVDGEDDFVGVDSSIFDVGTGDFSISLWANIVDADTNDRLFSVGNSNHYEIWMNSSGYYLALGGDSSSSRVSATSNNTYENDGLWHHVVAVYDRDYAISLYIDGVLQDDVEAGFTAYSSTDYNLTDARIGAYTDGSAFEPKGLIDDVRFYNYALTQEQVKLIMNNNSAVSFE